MSTKKFVIKVLIAGEGGVGKTTLLHKVTTGEFLSDTKITIGVQFHLLNVEYGDSLFVLQLWDFGGQERFRFMLDAYVAGAKAAMLLYDTTRLKTLDKLGDWVDIVRKKDDKLPILFVGTKIDRVADIQIQDEAVVDYLPKYNLFDHIKISSKTEEGITDSFKKLVQELASVYGMDVAGDKTHFKIYPPER